MGQTIDVCLADTGYTCNEIPISAYLGEGFEQQKEGNGRGTGGTYQTSDGWVILAATNQNMWTRLCKCIDKPDWIDDSKFASRNDRSKNAVPIEIELNAWFSDKTMAEAVSILSSNGIPCSPVNNTKQASEDPHMIEREIMMEVPDPIAGSIHVTGKMIKFGRTEMVVGSAPVVGEHSKEILSEILEYPDDKIGALSNQEIIGL